MPLYACNGCVKDLFVTDEEMIDRFTGTELWVWGRGSYARLANAVSIDRSSPVQTISGGTNWKSVAPGFCHSVAIKTDNTLWTWGKSGYGELGNNNSSVTISSPIQTISAVNTWKSASASKFHSAAIKTDGTLWVWGANCFGILGNNTASFAGERSSPVQTISGGTNWKEVSVSQYQSIAIKTDGTLWLWGDNYGGALGNNNIIPRSSPVQTVSGGTNWKQVSAGFFNAAAIKKDGTLWLWGRGYAGGLGNNSIINRSSPVQTVSGGTNWKFVNGSDFTKGAIKTDGSLWLWGPNQTGKLGDGLRISRSSPVQTISSGTNWKQVSAGINNTVAIKTDGTLWAWGQGLVGVIGDGFTFERSSPVQTISAGTNWRNASITYLHVMATKIADI